MNETSHVLNLLVSFVYMTVKVCQRSINFGLTFYTANYRNSKRMVIDEIA